MPYTGLAVPQYNRHRKRLSPAILKALNAVQARILQDPRCGDLKAGALKGVFVEKFPAENDQWLVAYAIDDKRNTVTFLAIGQHENFYRDLIRYRKETSEARYRSKGTGAVTGSRRREGGVIAGRGSIEVAERAEGAVGLFCPRWSQGSQRIKVVDEDPATVHR